MSNVLFKCTIPGRVGILKNGKQIFSVGKNKKRKIVIPKKQYIVWEQHAMLHCKHGFKGPQINERCEVHMKFFFKNFQHEPDLSNLAQGPEDVLQKAGVLADDKLIMREVTEKFFGHEPRVEIEIYPYAEGMK